MISSGNPSIQDNSAPLPTLSLSLSISPFPFIYHPLPRPCNLAPAFALAFVSPLQRPMPKRQHNGNFSRDERDFQLVGNCSFSNRGFSPLSYQIVVNRGKRSLLSLSQRLSRSAFCHANKFESYVKCNAQSSFVSRRWRSLRWEIFFSCRHLLCIWFALRGMNYCRIGY